MILDFALLCDLLEITEPHPPLSASLAGERHDSGSPSRGPHFSEARRSGFTGVTTLALAGARELCFAEHADQAEAVRTSHAGAVIVSHDFPSIGGPELLRTDRPRERFFQIAERFLPQVSEPGIHPSAVIATSARLADQVYVGPNAVIGADVRIGAGSVIGASCVIGDKVNIGADCQLEANVSIHYNCDIGDRCILHSGAVIGSDGFGFVWDGHRHRKVPQLGRVVIEDEVDIGCQTCVDRATLGETRIRFGTKIDNLVQIAHNTDIGAHVILVSQSGVAGSSRLGTGTVVAGQVAISDHLEIGAGARIGGQSGVTKNLPAGATVFGTPARPMKQTLRELAALAQLPALSKTVKGCQTELLAFNRRLTNLEQRSAKASSAADEPHE
jgi:UDP-3-O-[3-hydroxymyristoyl] glucosamine N-acyltransferase